MIDHLQVEEIRNIIENIESLVDVVKTKQSQILAAPTNDNGLLFVHIYIKV